MKVTRQAIIDALARHYSEKFGGKVWAEWDATKRAYSIHGENLKPHPDLAAQYPNGWSLLDFIPPSKARTILYHSPDPSTYRVRWEIEVTADSPKDAAQQALTIHRDPNSIAEVFDVIDMFGATTRVDLTFGK